MSLTTFYKEIVSNYAEIGAVLPSSPFLARAMTHCLRAREQPTRILEVGAGTGPFTRQLLRDMGEHDRLFVSEINPRLLSSLQQTLRRNANFKDSLERSTFIEGPAQALTAETLGGKIDLIVCGLPFTNFSRELAEEILTNLKAILNPHGKLVFFEYLLLRRIALKLYSPQKRALVEELSSLMQRWEESGAAEYRPVFLNFPPAKTVTLQFD